VFDDEARILIILPRSLVDRARELAGRATISMKVPVSVQIVLRALLEEGLKEPKDSALLGNIRRQADTVHRIRSEAGRRGPAVRTARRPAQPASRRSGS
jgi:hypothetical protein